MQTTIERVMQAYGMMVNLTAEQEKAARERLGHFLKNRDGDDRELAVQGLQFLRGNRRTQNRTQTA
jgi:hypothetical protein